LCEARILLEPGDLSDEDVAILLAQAGDLAAGGKAKLAGPGRSVGLLFLSPSLRTRVGFAEATVRLGGAPIDVSEPRWDPAMSDAESFDDTLRTVSGMVDAVVARVPLELDHGRIAAHTRAPYVSGGHLGHHPTQALIDVFAMEQLQGSVGDLRVGICGDLTMRATRSLLQLLTRRPPRQLVLVAPPSRREHGIDLGPDLAARTITREPDDLAGLDVLLLAGLPQGAGPAELDAPARHRYALTGDRVCTLDPGAVVLSPMPVIDEISPAARLDPRVRMFDQSDLGVFVRMAVLDLVVER
jgi:aspartate carbamoyltransferase catalytic subunit